MNGNHGEENGDVQHCRKCQQESAQAGKQQSFFSDLIEWNPENIEMKTPSFFWRAHTLTVLLLLLAGLFYVALIEVPSQDTDYNARRGAMAMAIVFVAFGVTQARDGPFTRPHPVFWRLVLCCSVIYELVLIYLLFQSADDARTLMHHFDENLGISLPEHDYGGSCRIYDPENVEDPFHNFWDKCDGFILGHFLGWAVKAVILRDWWICTILSLSFEILEYSLQHQLPNFSECWWDHWILDFLVCNGLGIYVGMLICHYLEMKQYNWRNLWSIEGYSGKLKRLALQLTPIEWRSFNWGANQSLKRWLTTIAVIVMFSLAELNVFYMKTSLWIPPPHYVVMLRLIIIALIGSVAIRETYDYLNDKTCKRFGQQAWVAITIILTELLISLRINWEIMTRVPPLHIIVFWSVVLLGVLVYTAWLFVRDFLLYHVDDDGRMEKLKTS